MGQSDFAQKPLVLLVEIRLPQRIPRLRHLGLSDLADVLYMFYGRDRLMSNGRWETEFDAEVAPTQMERAAWASGTVPDFERP
jgi:hypothetical protein